MLDTAAATIARPFETGVLEWPEGPLLILNARPNMGVPDHIARVSVAVQPERGLFNALKAEGFITHPFLPEISQPLAGALILTARQRAENDLMLEQASKHVTEGGLIVVAGAKNSGVEALAKAVAKSGVEIGKLSKNHALVFWATAPLLSPEAADFQTAETFTTPTGGFSAGHIDEGSKFLIDNLPPKLWGSVADFGAGWGYLSAEIAARCPKVATLTLVESRFEALEAGKQNLANITIPATFNWLDVTQEKLPGYHDWQFDWIVMNPPFHDALGTHAPELGQAFIKAAFKALKPNGQLLMVANKQLPYEKTLAVGYRKFETVAENGRFKVILARK